MSTTKMSPVSTTKMSPVTTTETLPTKPDSPLALVGGRSPAAFLARYWQRRALVVRHALPDSAATLNFASRSRLFALAQRDGVESRLVTRVGRRYECTQGPFRRRDLNGLPPRNWTLLVSGVNLEDPMADALLRRFAFLPFARLDDLMVSFAAPGGGVGPHYDSYDVFLLQATGRRRWRFGRQRDLTLRKNSTLRILERFAPDESATLGPGDLLYLPPDYAHDGVALDGVALDACVTCSIGFRAPLYQEFAEAFLDHFRDRVAIDGRYADPGLHATSRPAQIDASMQRQVATALARVRIDRRDVASFLGCWLTEPKLLVRFTPAGPLARREFVRRIRCAGIALDRRTQMLYDRSSLYINGEAMRFPRDDGETLRQLANQRTLDATACSRLASPTLALLDAWRRLGYLELPG